MLSTGTMIDILEKRMMSLLSLQSGFHTLDGARAMPFRGPDFF
jgi:hypothetical protein